MPSTVTNYSNTINTNFPPFGEEIVGVTEFNNNFKKIEKSFSILANEINDAATNNVLTNTDNNFGKSIISSARFTNTSYTVYTVGLLESGITNIDYAEGHYQKCVAKGGSYLFNLTNPPPSNTFGKLRLEISNFSKTDTANCIINFSGNTEFLGSRRIKYAITGSGVLFFDLIPFNQGQKYYVKCIGSDTELFTGTDITSINLNALIGTAGGATIPSSNIPTIPTPPTGNPYSPPAGWVLRPMTFEQFNQWSSDAEIIINLIRSGETLEYALPVTLIAFYQPELWKTVAYNLANSFRPGYDAFDATFPAMVIDNTNNIKWVYAPPEFNQGYNPLQDPGFTNPNFNFINDVREAR